MDRRLVEADRVLSEHFTSCIGVRAQSYEPAVTGGDRAPEEAIMAPAMVAARARYLMVETVLAGLGDSANVIRAVYAHGTDALSSAVDENGRPMAGKPGGLITTRNNATDPYGLLRVALAPTWGHGSYLRIAARKARALRAYERRYPDRAPMQHLVLDFLAYEAGRGDASARMLAEIRDECEAARNEALAAFARAYAHHLGEAAKRRQETIRRERQAAEETLAKARAARESGRLPECLRDLTGERRERLRAAALALLA